MSDAPQGPGWWQASDGKWYPPDDSAATPAPVQQPLWKRWWVIAIAVVVLLAAISAATDSDDDEDATIAASSTTTSISAPATESTTATTERPRTTTTAKQGPGKAEVYAEIAAETDCAELQAGFDRNMADAERREPNTFLRDVVLSYAEAYDKQMEKIGCYE